MSDAADACKSRRAASRAVRIAVGAAVAVALGAGVAWTFDAYLRPDLLIALLSGLFFCG